MLVCVLAPTHKHPYTLPQPPTTHTHFLHTRTCSACILCITRGAVTPVLPFFPKSSPPRAQFSSQLAQPTYYHCGRDIPLRIPTPHFLHASPACFAVPVDSSCKRRPPPPVDAYAYQEASETRSRQACMERDENGGLAEDRYQNNSLVLLFARV